MVEILEIGAQNFLTIQAKQSVKVAGRKMVFVTGENNASKSMKSNGAGKTSVFEIIPVTLYGKTTKGISGDEVVNRFQKRDCISWVEFRLGPDIYKATAYRKHKEFGNDVHFVKNGAEDLRGDTAAETRKKIEALIGMSFDLFVNSVYLPQEKVKPFAAMTDKELKTIFADVLSMEVWQLACENVRGRMKLAKVALDTKKRELSTCLDLISATTENLTTYVSQDASFAETKKKDLERISEAIADARADLEKAVRAVPDEVAIRKELEVIGFQLADSEERAKKKGELTRRLDGLRSERSKLHALMSVKTSEIEKVDRAISDLKSSLGEPCSECGRPVDDECLASFGKTRQAVKMATSKDIASFQKALARVEKEMAATASEIKKLSERDTEAVKLLLRKSQLVESLRALSGKRLEVAKISARLKKLEGHLQGEKKKESPFKDLIRKAGASLFELRSSECGYRAEIAALEGHVKHMAYLEKAFGYSGIPSRLLAETTPWLNRKIAEISSTLFPEISIELSTQTVTKAGEVKEKYSVSTVNEHGAEIYRGLSGGEKKRVDFCICLGFQELVRGRARPINILLFDEPFEGLDEVGIEGVVEVLQETRSGPNQVVFVISHQEEMRAHFDEEMRVVKNPKTGTVIL
jgi:DNA repair exonuclease SbcCD ATPase subunit